MKRRISVLIMTILAALGASAAPAQADYNPYNPYALCGFGYLAGKTEQVTAGGDPLPAGTLHILYNPGLDTFCAVTIKSRWVGIGTDSWIGLAGGTTGYVDSTGIRFYYNGPIYSRPFADHSMGTCISFGSRITSPGGVEYWHESVNPAIGYGLYCRR